MSAVGGSLKNVAIKGRIFPVASDADVTIKLGGYTNEIKMNGDGTSRIVKTRTSWEVSGIQIELSHDRGDHEFLQDIANLSEYVDCSITHADDTTQSGRGLPTGDFSRSSMNAVATLTLGGTGDLVRQ